MSCRQQQIRSLPSLNETYKKDDKKPFGSYVAYNHFKKLFNDRYVATKVEAFDVTWKNIKDYSSNIQYSLYFLLAKNLEVSNDEAEAMVDFIKEGNDMFIASDGDWDVWHLEVADWELCYQRRTLDWFD